MLIIDKYSYTNNLKDVNPIVKTYLTIVLLTLSLIMKNLYIHIGIVLIMIILIVGIGKISLKSYSKFLLIPISFLTLSIVTILISVSTSNVDFILGVKVFGYYVSITTESLSEAKILFFRAFAAVNCTFFLVLTTPMNQLIYVMNRHKVPKLFIELCVLMYRFIFIFLEESKEIYNAQELRFGYLNLKNSYKSLSILIVMLFSRVMLRYKELETALITKNFSGEFHI